VSNLAHDRFARRVALIVDDEPAIRLLLRALLLEHGLGAVEAGDGVEAIELLATQASQINLVLLDLSMPRMGGLEALAAISARWPGLPCVVMSGYSEAEVAGRAGGLSLAGCLEKPFSRQALQELLRRLFGQG
jgi:CheY-like chemotaxis protein